MELITTNEKLQMLLDDLLEKARKDPHFFITLDTEFLRERTYWSQLCLLQIGTLEDVYLIDPIGTSLNLELLKPLLFEPCLKKVLHAARQDLEIFYQLFGALPKNIFDTQIGAMFLGYPDSMGYDTLVQDMLGHKLDKSQRITNWSKRPLTTQQQTYAANDVRYLVQVYQKMKEKLTSLERLSWAEDEMQSLLEVSLYEPNPDQAWRRLRLKKSHPTYLMILKLLAAWREERALMSNTARGFVVKDDVLEDIALVRPKTLEKLKSLQGIKGVTPQDQAQLFHLLETALQTSLEECPHLPHAPKSLPCDVVAFAKLFVESQAKTMRLCERLVATSKELQSFLLSPENGAHPLHQGWRYTYFGHSLQSLRAGKMMAQLQEDRLVFSTLGDLSS